MMTEFGDNRMAHILFLFCVAPTQDAAALAARLDISERTVRNDIKQLNIELRDCGLIEGGQGKYTLHIYDVDRFREIQARILENGGDLNSPRNRQDYLFGRLMRAQAPLLTDELAYEMNVGRSTLVSDMKRLRTALEPYQLSVQGKTSQGLTLQGREQNIRHYILERCFDTLYRDYPLDEEIVTLVQEAFDQTPVGRTTRQRFEQFLTVMLDRFLTGHPIGELSTAFYRLAARPEFQAVNALANRIGEFLHVDIPAEEKLFVLLPIVGMRTPADVVDMRAIQLDPAMRPLQEKIFQQIKSEMDLLIADPEFEEEFLYHLMFMVNRLRFHVRLKSPMAAELREKYPLAWRMAGIAAQVIRNEQGVEVTEDEHSYLASYFGVFIEESGLKHDHPFRIAVVCGTGRVTARLVAAQLRRVLDSASELTLLSCDKVTLELLAGFDLVFTTVELPCQTGRPVILIHEIFNEQELRHKIEKARYWDQVDVPMLDNNWFVMVGLLDESRFFVLDDVDTYDHALERMASALVAQGQADPEFLSRLRAREKLGTTVFDQSVAIPHTVQYASDRLVLAVGVCPKPIRQGEREIRTIFLMGLPQDPEHDTLLVRVYEELISITQDKDILDKIAAANSFQALLRALYRQA